jgi:aldehyde dehydrogenase (NAD+)
MLAELLVRAGVPTGVCNVVTGTGPAAGAALVRHPLVRHVSFTGSVQTGVDVAREAAEHVTRTLLELGGKSPLIVLADADLAAAVEGVMGAIFENAGQICSAGSRLHVDRRIHAEMVSRLVSRARALAMGHGLRRPQLGPLNSAPHQARVTAHLEAARARGLEIATGGLPARDPATGLGWFFEPTIVDEAPAADAIVQEEIFGPVLAVQPFETEEEALALANGTRFALVAGIYTRDFSAAHRFARDVDAGQVYINEYFAGGIEVPFGGNRMSGYGREKGLAALDAYTRTKSVVARI